jgi:hypothetical protein
MSEHKGSNRFLVEYAYAGSHWTVEVWADDWKDAERKLYALKTNARIIGESMAKIVPPNGLGRCIAWVADAFKRD